MTAGWTDPAFQQVAALLGERTGLAFFPARVADAEAGIRRAMARTRAAAAADYLEALRTGQAELDELITELTVGETYFFREPLQWEVLRDQVLPELLRARPAGHVLRVWSAGCASGEEAYSLAVLLDELGLVDRSQILATDLSRTALEKARRAVYGAWSLRGIDPSIVLNHFSPHGARWRLHERLRARVDLERLNLAADPYPSFANGTWRMDLILCRNVLIYLAEAAVERVLHQLAECLAPGGWLLTGASDPVPTGGALEPITTKAGVLYRRPEARRATPTPRPAPSARGSEGWGAAEVPVPMAEPSNDGDRWSTLSSSSSGAAAPAPDPLAAARAAFARGNYGKAQALAAGLPDPAAAVLGVRAAANERGTAEAERLAASSSARHPECVELHLLHAVLLIDLGRHDEAVEAARRAVYLDRRLVIGHYLLGTALVHLGDLATAARAFRNAHSLAASLPPDLPIPFGDGQRAAGVAQAAGTQLERLATSEVS
jgi:chemotaxis protein methyltransferase CheR